MTPHEDTLGLDLDGLELGPSQVLGAVRLVPLLRAQPIEGLRLASQALEACGASLREDKDGHLKEAYLGYVPHALILRFGEDATVRAARGAQLLTKKERIREVPLVRRMVRKLDGQTLRLLPLDLAMEGMLSIGFRGPDVAWRAYSEQVVRHGLGVRSEEVWGAEAVRGLSEAVRTFEIVHGQSGVLVFVEEALASAFVTPSAADYRRLHASLLQDFFSELIVTYSTLPTFELEISQPASAPKDLAAVAARVDRARHAWRAYSAEQSRGLFGPKMRAEVLRRKQGFVLRRFRSSLLRGDENHIGECIHDAEGRLAYLKTFRLSTAQTRRARLLSTLGEVNWNLKAAAAKLKVGLPDLLGRLERAGFGYLLTDEVRARGV